MKYDYTVPDTVSEKLREDITQLGIDANVE